MTYHLNLDQMRSDVNHLMPRSPMGSDEARWIAYERLFNSIEDISRVLMDAAVTGDLDFEVSDSNQHDEMDDAPGYDSHCPHCDQEMI